MWIIGTVSALLGVLLIFWMCRVVLTAFVKEKDDTFKQVVIMSKAHSFVVLFILQIAVFIMSFFNFFESFMYELRQTIYLHPIALYVIILGISLFINKIYVKFRSFSRT